MFSIMDVKDEKYVVFKSEDFNNWINEHARHVDFGSLPAIFDAVVIRRQDVFAPPALDTYANSILATVEALSAAESPEKALIARLSDIAAYFHAQADMAWDTVRKLPD